MNISNCRFYAKEGKPAISIPDRVNGTRVASISVIDDSTIINGINCYTPEGVDSETYSHIAISQGSVGPLTVSKNCMARISKSEAVKLDPPDGYEWSILHADNRQYLEKK